MPAGPGTTICRGGGWLTCVAGIGDRPGRPPCTARSDFTLSSLAFACTEHQRIRLCGAALSAAPHSALRRIPRRIRTMEEAGDRSGAGVTPPDARGLCSPPRSAFKWAGSPAPAGIPRHQQQDVATVAEHADVTCRTCFSMDCAHAKFAICQCERTCARQPWRSSGCTAREVYHMDEAAAGVA